MSFEAFVVPVLFFFFFNDTATTEIYTLSLHDALPISRPTAGSARSSATTPTSSSASRSWPPASRPRDRKSTRLNSRHPSISYAVFCLKKKTIRLHGGVERESVDRVVGL